MEQNEMSEILLRCDERYVKKDDFSMEISKITDKLAKQDVRLSVVEQQIKINNWLSLAIAGGIVALVIKVFIGG